MADIWWCEAHKQNGYKDTECYFYRQCQPARGDCRMVPMSLVPRVDDPTSGLIREWIVDRVRRALFNETSEEA